MGINRSPGARLLDLLVVDAIAAIESLAQQHPALREPIAEGVPTDQVRADVKVALLRSRLIPDPKNRIGADELVLILSKLRAGIDADQARRARADALSKLSPVTIHRDRRAVIALLRRNHFRDSVIADIEAGFEILESTLRGVQEKRSEWRGTTPRGGRPARSGFAETAAQLCDLGFNSREIAFRIHKTIPAFHSLSVEKLAQRIEKTLTRRT